MLIGDDDTAWKLCNHNFIGFLTFVLSNFGFQVLKTFASEGGFGKRIGFCLLADGDLGAAAQVSPCLVSAPGMSQARDAHINRHLLCVKMTCRLLKLL